MTFEKTTEEVLEDMKRDTEELNKKFVSIEREKLEKIKGIIEEALDY